LALLRSDRALNYIHFASPHYVKFLITATLYQSGSSIGDDDDDDWCFTATFVHRVG